MMWKIHPNGFLEYEIGICGLEYDIGKCGQELSTLKKVRDYIQRKIDFVYGFDKYERELCSLSHIRDYVEIEIDIVWERYHRMSSRMRNLKKG